jgi:hypothetical protein
MHAVSDPDDSLDDAVLDPAVLVGARCNSTRIHTARDEVTIDFLRHVPDTPRRFLVARALLSTFAAFGLRDQLDEALRGFTDLSMPEEAE